jgi:hypothetical protein
MRTLLICLIIALMSTAAAIVTIARDYNKPLAPPANVRIIKPCETGGGDRTHTTGHGYYMRRAERGK